MVTELSKTIGVTETARLRRRSRATILLSLEGKRNEIGAAASCSALGKADLRLQAGSPVCRRWHATASGAGEEGK